jgi:hypothetical protein
VDLMCASMYDIVHVVFVSLEFQYVFFTYADYHPIGGWRGRSEKIVLLKCKVKELESELADHRGRKDPKQAAVEKVRDVDKLAREDLREMEEARRQATEQLSHQYHVSLFIPFTFVL